MQPLLEVSGYGEPDRLAETLVSELCTLPWKYALTLGFYFPLADKLLHVLPNEGDTFALGESLRIVRPDATYPQMFPLVSGVEERDRRIYRRGLFAPTIDPSEWNYGRAYLVLEKEGYVPMWGTSTPLEESIGDIKAFAGIGLAIRLFDARRDLSLAHALGGVRREKITVHRREISHWQLAEAVEISLEASELWTKLDLIQEVEEQYWKGWIGNRLPLIRLAFDQRPRTQKIRLAAEWLFDSHASKSELLAFVQAAVAIEILLGDKTQSDGMGLGKLLANRCAYLIGKSHRQREEVLKEFETIYKLRSKIVHEGKTRLDRKERELFWALRWMCGRAIQEELELLRVEEEEKA